MTTDTTVPDDLPVPVDNGECDHLTGCSFPSLDLPTTSGNAVNLVIHPNDLTIIFCYPRTAAPNETVPDEWNAIPGARGCTPQACSFRDLLSELKAHGVKSLYGFSTQSTEYQQEVKERLHLPYDLISDESLALVRGLNLPTMEWKGDKLVKRITLAVSEGKIIHIWYPVFPTDKSADEYVK
jgi:peroxiredoxin